ncbi:MAG TPA: glycosyltransferase family 2 protein [Nevskiaceae bacterium]|nr:glycosyltransferase family 2 protein [Nevskiaceae bacterium]
MAKFDVTIAILTFNGEEFLDQLLHAVFTQKTRLKYEVLVIESGSTDGTLDIIKKYPKVRLHPIPNTEFGHGRTRNLAVKLADSEFVVFLTQDAVPSQDRWLDSMIYPFGLSDKVGCVFGKQIPRPNCFATLKREVRVVFDGFGPDHSIPLHYQNDLTKQLGATMTFFSDVNSAVRRSVVANNIPFRDVKYAEDQAMGIDMLAAGYIKAYAPFGSVWHSHNYPLRKYFRRKFDESVGLRKTTGHVQQAGLKELTLGTAKATLHDYRFIWRDQDYSFGRKLHDFALAPCYNFANRWAMRKAASKKLSAADEAKMSLEANARKKAQ